MNIQDYEAKIKELKFQEFPFFITGAERQLGSFIEFEKTDLDLKLRLAKVVICRCFSPTGGIYWPADVDWFITNANTGFERDFNKPWITSTIKRAFEMIMSVDDMTDGVIATTFMFGVIEFYAKTKLGWESYKRDFFDDNYNAPFREMYIGSAIQRVKKTKCDLARSLNEIDKHNERRLKDSGIAEERFTKAKIADRLTLARNTMAHGENHSFYDKGKYLMMLYFLFYYHDLKEKV
ncbi:MAG: hypothetical protein JWO03_215 [Bacteroidetes bacterium]|nr:hypothetical protein [Bacteroidota bacterium]